MHIFVLDKIDCLDDINVVQRRRNAELRGELLDIFLLCFVLAPFPEFLRHGTG